MKLPREIRYDIWHLAQANNSRVVEFTPHGARRPRSSSPYWKLLFSCTAPNILLSVNKEARNDLLHHYVEVNPHSILPPPKPGMGPLLVCPMSDTFFVNLTREMAESLPRESISSIFEYLFGDKAQVVKIRTRKLVGSRHFWESVDKTLGGMRNVPRVLERDFVNLREFGVIMHDVLEPSRRVGRQLLRLVLQSSLLGSLGGEIMNLFSSEIENTGSNNAEAYLWGYYYAYWNEDDSWQYVYE